MKTNRLYMLRQFIDEIINGELSTILESEVKNTSQTKLYLIYKYNLFLNRPLDKKIELMIDENLYNADGMWRYKPCETLRDLAQATNGQLKLKNITL